MQRAETGDGHGLKWKVALENNNAEGRDWGRARAQIREFVEERDWDQFHSLKDLAIGLGAESGELLEQVLWKTPSELADGISVPGEARTAFLDEVADILFFVIRLLDKADANPWDILEAKLQKNREKYPVELSRGRADKYTKLKSE